LARESAEEVAASELDVLGFLDLHGATGCGPGDDIVGFEGAWDYMIDRGMSDGNGYGRGVWGGAHCGFDMICWVVLSLVYILEGRDM
jgi:hypothetical protein